MGVMFRGNDSLEKKGIILNGMKHGLKRENISPKALNNSYMLPPWLIKIFIIRRSRLYKNVTKIPSVCTRPSVTFIRGLDLKYLPQESHKEKFLR